KSSSKVSGHHHCCIIQFLSKQDIQHRFPRSSSWLSVITAPHNLLPFSYYISIAVMSGVPVFLSHFLNKAQGLFFLFHWSHSSDKTRFFFDDFSFAAF